jgi:sugar lactone lactonase YvrE
MSAAEAELLLDALFLVLESPIWDAGRGGLWWIDVRAPALYFLADGKAAPRTWPMPSTVGFVALSDNGMPIVGLCDGIHLFEPDVVLSDLYIPNGLSFDPAGRWLSFADTVDGRLRLLWTENPWDDVVLLPAEVEPGAPDGCALDSEGFVWSARLGAGCILRIAPNGEVERRISVPAPDVAGLCFGGADGRTLFITTLRARMSCESLERWPLSGGLFACHAPAPGVPEHRLPLQAPLGLVVRE